LKQRRGYSYEWISRKTKLSRSSVHRYCTALSVPPDFGPAEQIAKACGASRDELIELHRRWLDAGSAEDSPAETRESTPPKSRRAGFVVVAVVSAIVLAATVLTVVL